MQPDTRTLFEIPLDMRIRRALARGGVQTVDELSKMTPEHMQCIAGMGPKSVKKVQEVLALWRRG